ncbi:hypothetical protein KI387_035293, partial [Taxus chinensis]
MVTDVVERRLIVLFVEGLIELQRGLVRAFDPFSLQEEIKKALDLDGAAPKSEATSSVSKANWRGEQVPKKTKSISLDQRKKPLPKVPHVHTDLHKTRLEKEAKNELRRKNLCFSCKDPWTLGHRFLGKGKVHYIEVISDCDDDDIVDEAKQNDVMVEEGIKKLKGTLTTLSGAPRYNPFCVRGDLHGQK